jgi:hypothetical protein
MEFAYILADVVWLCVCCPLTLYFTQSRYPDIKRVNLPAWMTMNTVLRRNLPGLIYLTERYMEKHSELSTEGQRHPFHGSFPICGAANLWERFHARALPWRFTDVLNQAALAAWVKGEMHLALGLTLQQHDPSSQGMLIPYGVKEVDKQRYYPVDPDSFSEEVLADLYDQAQNLSDMFYSDFAGDRHAHLPEAHLTRFIQMLH